VKRKNHGSGEKKAKCKNWTSPQPLHLMQSSQAMLVSIHFESVNEGMRMKIRMEIRMEEKH
jgi:hypothetical protein